MLSWNAESFLIANFESIEPISNSKRDHELNSNTKEQSAVDLVWNLVNDLLYLKISSSEVLKCKFWDIQTSA